MSDQRVCEHGSLTRQCELCDRDETIAHLSSRLTAAECSLNIRYALRREIEAALGITSEMASDAALAVAQQEIARRLLAQGEVAKELDAERKAHVVTATTASDAKTQIERLVQELAALKAQRCESCGEYDPGYCNLRGHQADFDMTCPKWRKRESYD